MSLTRCRIDPIFSAIFHHLRLSLRLNLKSPQALIYGYVVPIFFLFAFGTLFRSGRPILLGQMGQLLTISVLGGACFGMPTGMVAERERGIWRRYRLLPVGTPAFVVSTLISRWVIIASAAVMQVGLARLVYKTPLPNHPLHLVGIFTVVTFAFEGLGLVIAGLANDVPAVQALGQAVFLPMIMIGGVGVPLMTLPGWAQRVAGFFPGRYAVEALQPCFDFRSDFSHLPFQLLALVVIGAAACVSGALLFRWDSGQRATKKSAAWVLLALAAWVGVGSFASVTGKLPTIVRTVAATNPAEPWMAITDEQLQAFVYTGLPKDDDRITPVAASATDLLVPEELPTMKDIIQKLDAWPAGHTGSDGQRVRNYLSVAAVADVAAESAKNDLEGNIARAVFDRLGEDFDHDELEHILGWIILTPDEGQVLTDVPEVGVSGPVNADIVRQRSQWYALKLLGRLLGKITDAAPDGP